MKWNTMIGEGRRVAEELNVKQLMKVREIIR